MSDFYAYLPEGRALTEADLWAAIAESLGVDESQISDGDIADYA